VLSNFHHDIGDSPSVLWCCWLGGRKGIWPVNNWVVGCWHGYLSGARCIWPGWCHCHSQSLASVKSRLVLPFWYRLTRVVPDKGPLNWCVLSPRSSASCTQGRAVAVNKQQCACYIWYWHRFRISTETVQTTPSVGSGICVLTSPWVVQ